MTQEHQLANISSGDSDCKSKSSCLFIRFGWLGAYACGIIMLIITISIFGEAMLRHAITPDMPWILRSGQYILEQGRLPSHDIFSWTHPEKPWLLYQWLFEVVVALGERFLGLDGLVRLFIVSVFAIYFLIPFLSGKIQGIPVLFTAPIAALLLIIISVNISLRPMLVTSLFLAMQYLLIRRFRREDLSFKALILLTVVIFMLWGNMHTGVTLGIFPFMLLMALGDWLELKGWYVFSPALSEMEKGKPQGIRFYAILALAGFLASLANPYGLGIYQYLIDLSLQSYLNNTIIELQSPDFHMLAYRAFLVLFVGFMLLMPKTNRVFAAHEVLLLATLTMMMLFVQRFVVWTCLFYALILPKALHYWFIQAKHPNQWLQQLIGKFESCYPALILLIAISMGAFLFFPSSFPPVRYGKCQSLMPAIAAYHKLKQPTDRLLNDPEFGSCLLLKYPDQKVFIDTRFDFYGQDFSRQSRSAISLLQGWDDFLKRWQIDTILMKKQWPLARLLAESPDYRVLFEDEEAILLQKQVSTRK